MNSAQSRIAIIDDEESVRRALARLLTSAGYQAEQFSGGAEFLASLSRRIPDCLVLDLHMPELDGFAVLQAVSELRPPPPVVVITGHDTPEARQRVADTGGCAFLRKPIDATLLISTIAAEMGRCALPPSGSTHTPVQPPFPVEEG